MIVLDSGVRLAASGAEYLAPVEPTKIIATHLTYRSRVEEYAARTPAEPSYFMKPLSTLNGHGGVLRRPRGARFLNYEGEVAAVIGRRMHGVPQADALAYVAGYAPANDVGLHDFRHADRGSMLRVKGQDGFCPIGPALTAAEDFDPTDFDDPHVPERRGRAGGVGGGSDLADLLPARRPGADDHARAGRRRPHRARRPTRGRWSRAMWWRSRPRGSGGSRTRSSTGTSTSPGPGEQLQVSANTLHVALAMPEDEAEEAVRSGRS